MQSQTTILREAGTRISLKYDKLMESMIEEGENMCQHKLAQSTPLSKYRVQNGTGEGIETLSLQFLQEVFILQELLGKVTTIQEEPQLLP